MINFSSDEAEKIVKYEIFEYREDGSKKGKKWSSEERIRYIRKMLNSKLISIFLAVCLVFQSSVYGIDLSKRTHLRVPLSGGDIAMLEEYEQILEWNEILDEADKLEERLKNVFQNIKVVAERKDLAGLSNRTVIVETNYYTRVGKFFIMHKKDYSLLPEDIRPDSRIIIFDGNKAKDFSYPELGMFCYTWTEGVILALQYLALRMPEGSLKNMRLLDAGAGVGLVCLAAARLEAEVLGIEKDKYIMEMVFSNVNLNGFSSEQIDLRTYHKRIENVTEKNTGNIDIIVLNQISFGMEYIKRLCGELSSTAYFIVSGDHFDRVTLVRERLNQFGFDLQLRVVPENIGAIAPALVFENKEGSVDKIETKPVDLYGLELNSESYKYLCLWSNQDEDFLRDLFDMLVRVEGFDWLKKIMEEAKNYSNSASPSWQIIEKLGFIKKDWELFKDIKDVGRAESAKRDKNEINEACTLLFKASRSIKGAASLSELDAQGWCTLLGEYQHRPASLKLLKTWFYINYFVNNGKSGEILTSADEIRTTI